MEFIQHRFTSSNPPRLSPLLIRLLDDCDSMVTMTSKALGFELDEFVIIYGIALFAPQYDQNETAGR